MSKLLCLNVLLRSQNSWQTLPIAKKHVPNGKWEHPNGKKHLPNAKLELPNVKKHLPNGKWKTQKGEKALPNGVPECPQAGRVIALR